MRRHTLLMCLAALAISFHLPSRKGVAACLSCNVSIVKFVPNARLTRIQQREKSGYHVKREITACTGKRKFPVFFLLPKPFGGFPNRSRLFFHHLQRAGGKGNVLSEGSRKVIGKCSWGNVGSKIGSARFGDNPSGNHSSGNHSSGNHSSGNHSSGNHSSGNHSRGNHSSGKRYFVSFPIEHASRSRKHLLQLKMCASGESASAADTAVISGSKQKGEADAHSDISPNLNKSPGVSMQVKKNEDVCEENNHGEESRKPFTVEELKEIGKNCSYLKINETESDEYSIELYFHFREFKLLRKKDETVNSLINRLILNMKKSNRKRKKRPSKSCNQSMEQPTEDVPTNDIQLYDKENKLVEDSSLLINVVDKLSYILINKHKVEVFKGLYDLKQIYVSMDVYTGHPIIPVGAPMDDLHSYVHYWTYAHDKKVILSQDLFYKPRKEDKNEKLHLVIYNKEKPFFFYVTNEIEVLSNEYEEELKRKGERYLHFEKVLKEDEPCNGNILRILTYNILAPIYTNTKYALEYMFKNIDPCYLKTNYRSHLLIHDISYDYDIICLQEVSEHLHSNLFSVYLHNDFYSSYKPKSSHGNDGCSLFVNKKKFSLIEYKNYEFNQVVKIPELKDVYDAFINLSNDLEEIIREIKTVFQVGIYTHRSSRNVFLVANTHFYFHSLASHIRALQSYSLLHILETLKKVYEQKYGTAVYVVLSGDFNTNFESEVFSFLEGKDIDSNSHLWINSKLFKKEYDDLNKYPTLFDFAKSEHNNNNQIIGPHLDRKKFLPLYSAYKKGDIAYTNWNNNFIDVLDYIFLSPGLKVRRVLKGISKEKFEKYGGVLSPINPSDHISIATEVEI
ncbi:endonuclease/exonuclease/phosphatase family protein, putative [Plasmodium knowlesi strain H]|uniref:Endonuclease/exonuclease/phosphatase family protein, putative n=3 Tax=Plasmodium knowlesi TaxID=5850 RepID=A0A5K1UM95_PLAKH|nr:CCR4 domain-containing protein 4, putative [Plasmodium knowlesi strain H]OTN65798.1 putative Endonuclease/exonuclease/phosphatase family protein [Plasmodium knowlesi]CAA9987863.1 CCR4 domain-containing protein 4, putative [Plasmodium knowlesi strain H]SBO22302.1 endonuclease/exonuclease/phosphatase family protein, putative [Plasmodium knowlesi strain H]SBO28796.1 endonuclease/exonuclease/phosphatase family protein, putative [Plasmodium knowlesi strain H]VVS77337.1 CCR4 domain-containing pro|eukprot:XP_002258861.1 endonuclease/exonuclease/phosphatase family protein, putative [Plasmodium knowlesi strain H]